MESYYELSDFVLMPYLSNNMSSGVLGHATKYNKPVVTGKGLLGEIVEEHRLGISINTSIPDLSAAIQNLAISTLSVNNTNFADSHSITQFCNILISSC